MLVQDFLQNSAQRLPDKVALICGQNRFTYAELDQCANRLAQRLIEAGVQRGDRVAIYLQNSVEAVISIFGVLKAGAVFVMLNASTKTGKVLYILNNCRAVVIITDDILGDAKLCEEVFTGVKSIKTIVVAGSEQRPVAGTEDFWAIQKHSSDAQPSCRNIDLDLACLIYTSGTTGEPKGVMADHSNVVFAASSITEYLRNVESDIVLNVLPLSFDYGLYQLLMTFKFGGTLVLERSFAYPASILNRIEEERVTGFPGVPTIFAMLLKMDLSSFDLSSLRYISNTAAALPAIHIRELRMKFPDCRVYSMYGLTETKRTLYLPPEWLDRKAGSVGIAIPGTEVWIENESGERLGPGEVGELVVRGRHVMRGYWEAPDISAARFRPGPIPGERLCYTGDLFRMDDEGCMYFVSRKDDVIKSRGEKVAPKEVENVLYDIGDVVEAAVIGVPDPILGQAIKAILVPGSKNITSAQVLAHCRKHLEDYMVPKIVEFRETLPKSPSGKIRKQELV